MSIWLPALTLLTTALGWGARSAPRASGRDVPCGSDFELARHADDRTLAVGLDLLAVGGEGVAQLGRHLVGQRTQVGHPLGDLRFRRVAACEGLRTAAIDPW